jgi:hypothetical protein
LLLGFVAFAEKGKCHAKPSLAMAWSVWFEGYRGNSIRIYLRGPKILRSPSLF